MACVLPLPPCLPCLLLLHACLPSCHDPGAASTAAKPAAFELCMSRGAASAGWMRGDAVRACSEGAWRTWPCFTLQQLRRRLGGGGGGDSCVTHNGRMALAAPALLSDPLFSSIRGWGFTLCFMLSAGVPFVRSAWPLLVLLSWLCLSCLSAVDPTAAALAVGNRWGAVACTSARWAAFLPLQAFCCCNVSAQVCMRSLKSYCGSPSATNAAVCRRVA